LAKIKPELRLKPEGGLMAVDAWSVYIGGTCSGITITNSVFGCNPRNGSGGNGFQGWNIQGGPFALTLKYDTFDWSQCYGNGGFGGSIGAVGNCQTGSACNVDQEYLWIRDSGNDIWIASGYRTAFIYRYDAIENPWAVNASGTGLHGNAMSWGSCPQGSPGMSGIVIDYNLIFEPGPNFDVGGEFIQMYCQDGGADYMNAPDVSFNTFPAPLVQANNLLHGSTPYSTGTTTVTNGTVSNNYCDGKVNCFYKYRGSTSFPPAQWPNQSGNTNMSTGATITP
jgi:hypothetical protein